MKHLIFLNNYDIRPCKAQYLWQYYYFLSKFPKAHFIINRDYLAPGPNRWEAKEFNVASFKPEKLYVLPKFEEFQETLSATSPSQLLREVVNYEIPSLVMKLIDIINEDRPDVVFTWCNNRSLEVACQTTKVPCVHVELGPLRSPFFKDTRYFDFTGVNGNTEFYQRFQEFKKVADRVKILGRPDLLGTICKDEKSFIEISKITLTVPLYECGVALQVDLDTNLIAFNEGISQADLINKATREYGKVLVRNHPMSTLGWKSPLSLGGTVLDTSENSLEFISKCKRIRTINSSVGFEALLMGKEVFFEGDTPFKELAKMKEEELLLALNFAIFSYLVPVSAIEDEQYHLYRINCKDEKELFEVGQERWLTPKV